MTTEFPPLDDVWFLTGPTASGKTRVGVALAQKIGAEIVSLDSMAVYRGMDVGTAKPTETERLGVPHHLIDLVEPGEDFSIAAYLTAAHACAAEIRSRGLAVLFVGGTPLYLKALLRGLTSGPGADSQLRQRLAAEVDRAGPERLHARLAEIDSDAAAKIHPHDARRIIRALEVYEATGQPISATQEHFSDASQAATHRVFVLDWPRATLHRRINERVEAMFAAGLEAEVRRLRASAGGLGRTAAQAVGYREVQRYLDGQCDLPTAIERTKARTRQFARRQLIWFRALPECRWVGVDEPFDSNVIAGKVLAMAPSHPRETLVCIGGPLHAKRLSVPAGLRWFSFGDDSLGTETLGDPGTGVVAIETIASVGRYGWATDETEPDEPTEPPVYIRRQFVTGESGLIHVFSFRKD